MDLPTTPEAPASIVSASVRNESEATALAADLATLREIEVRLGTPDQKSADITAAREIAHRLANRLVQSALAVEVRRQILTKYGAYSPKMKAVADADRQAAAAVEKHNKDVSS